MSGNGGGGGHLGANLGVATADPRRPRTVRRLATVAALAVLVAAGWAVVTTRLPEAPAARPCTDEWFSYVDENYSISDDQGHGPDWGSTEWFNAFERRSGLPLTDRWPQTQRCRLIQQQLEARRFVVNEALGIVTSF